MKKFFNAAAGVCLLGLLVSAGGCVSLSLEERIVQEGEEQKERLARQQRNFEQLKSRMKFVCTPVVIPNYSNRHLNVASVKLSASCRRAAKSMLKYIAEREKEDNIRNVITKVFVNPDNFIDIRPTKVGEFPRPDGTVQKMTPAEFVQHLQKVKKQIGAAASEVIVNEQKKSKQEARLLKFSAIELWQMELAKHYMDFAGVMTDNERTLYRKELRDYHLWNDIVAGDRAVRRLSKSNKNLYYRSVLREIDTAASVSKAVLIEIERFRKICIGRHAHKVGWEKNIAIAAEAARVAPYISKVVEQSCYSANILSYMADEWKANWYDVENDLMNE